MGRIIFNATEAVTRRYGCAFEELPAETRAEFEAIGERVGMAMGAKLPAAFKELETHRMILRRLDSSLRGEAGC